jgi:ABC-type nitrate/sulfonate/bicarbonate transport system substrate-binding protein
VGDLQSLYGGENGYPQAVLVAKKELTEEHSVWTNEFVEDVKASMEWLKTATGEQIVSTVNGHLDSNLQESSLKAPLLTAAVIGRCGVRYVPSIDCKADARKLLESFIAINPQSTVLPQSAFFGINVSVL